MTTMKPRWRRIPPRPGAGAGPKPRPDQALGRSPRRLRDCELYPGEILAVIGDNGAGQTSLIRRVGALVPDSADPLDGKLVIFRNRGRPCSPGSILYQSLAVAPVSNRRNCPRPQERSLRLFRCSERDKKHMLSEANRHLSYSHRDAAELGHAVRASPVVTPGRGGGRSASFGSKVLPRRADAALWSSGQRVLQLIR